MFLLAYFLDHLLAYFLDHLLAYVLASKKGVLYLVGFLLFIRFSDFWQPSTVSIIVILLLHALL